MMSSGLVLRPTAALPRQAVRGASSRRAGLVVRADNKPLREYNENDGKVSAVGGTGGTGDAAGKEEAPPKFLYAEENPQPRDTMSPEMKARLRKEYIGFGGSPNKPMKNNYFLYIILIISALAVASKLSGAI